MFLPVGIGTRPIESQEGPGRDAPRHAAPNDSPRVAGMWTDAIDPYDGKLPT